MSTAVKLALPLILGLSLATPALTQTPATPLLTQPINEVNRATLHGSVHPLVRTASDRGAVSNSFLAGRLLLLLNRPPEREAALREFLQAAHATGSASYHKWLTPQQFGEQFGPADSDVQSVVQWLQSHGFSVQRVSKSGTLIEFSGTAGQISEAFHTQIHEYAVKDETHYANANEMEIPQALAPLVRGVAPLNDFRAQPQVQIAGRALYSSSKRAAKPQWTLPNPYGTANLYAYPVTPEDFATQYDLAPLYQAGVTGAGQTIGIINESNIDLGLVQAYQSLFGVAGAPPQVVIDGDDPGTLSGVDVEAYLDVELSGAVAPKATVNLYIASGSSLQDPLELAALRAVEDNQASVLSVSFGQCEMYLGTAGNQFWASLWEQAAAQGQTVFVSSGDTGSECTIEQVNTVSGLASTPWNVAVGGTDFYYGDYATGGASATTLWNQTNDANLGSLIAPLPEQAWNDLFGFDIISNGYQRNEIYAGGGGVSNCTTQNVSTLACSAGYAKPGWQSGPGVPADSARDIPDVSLFASNGSNLSAYVICAYAGDCVAGSGGSFSAVLVGGTSASSPAMAGIMALVNQKYGRQGQADFTLYALAQQKPAAFHDVTVGNNSELCGGQANPPNCVLQWNGMYGTPQYAAGTGYDQASGLGSVDAAQLVNNWNSVAFKSTTTTLQLSSASVTHGTPVTITTSVAASGSGTPTGEVAILTDSPLPASQGQTLITLANGTGSTSANYLPGGEYRVTGHYGGDGVFAASTSSAETLTVTPEKSNLNFSVRSGTTQIASGGSVAYGAPLTLYIQPTGVSAAAGKTNGNATGSATFMVDSVGTTVALNGSGVANWSPAALAIGSHTVNASYSGDASFAGSTATPVNFTVTKGIPMVNISVLSPQSMTAPEYEVNPGDGLTMTAIVGPGFGFQNSGNFPQGMAAPTGTVTFCLTTNFSVGVQPCATPAYSATVALSSPSGLYSSSASATVTLPNLAAGYYMPEFVYNGDANWQSQGLDYITTVNVAPIVPLAATTTALSASSIGSGEAQKTVLTTTVTGSGSSGVAPTGDVFYYDNGVFIAWDILPPAATGTTTTAIFSLGASSFWNNGANQLTAVYLGDSNYAPSTSDAIDVTASQTVGDFALAPQLPQITLKSGSTGTVGVNLTSLGNFNGAVALTCAPSSSQISCSLTPSTVTVNGAATATLSINAVAHTGGVIPEKRPGGLGWPVGSGLLAFAFLLWGGRARRTLSRNLLVGLCVFVAGFAISCGGGGGTKTNNNPPPPPPTYTAYSVVVTGTANGITHNAKITVEAQ